jgi:putative ABC transport system substrate-binding protein
MKKILLFITALILCAGSSHADQKLIVINQFVQHPALDAVASGLEKQLNNSKYDFKIIKQFAAGSIATSVQISQNLASLSPDAMVAIATPSAQTMLKARKDKKILLGFAAVTDPESAGLSGAENIIGIADAPPVEELFAKILSILPGIKTIGVLSNPGEVNSNIVVEKAKKFATSNNLTLIVVPVNSSNDVAISTKSLIGKVDAIYLPQDNTVISAIDLIAKITKQHKIPLFSNDPMLIDRGVMIALGCDYFSVGQQLGQMIISKLQNTKIAGGDIQLPIKKQFSINKELAAEFNLQLAGVTS